MTGGHALVGVVTRPLPVYDCQTDRSNFQHRLGPVNNVMVDSINNNKPPGPGRFLVYSGQPGHRDTRARSERRVLLVYTGMRDAYGARTAELSLRARVSLLVLTLT